jgi:hypothetical protein
MCLTVIRPIDQPRSIVRLSVSTILRNVRRDGDEIVLHSRRRQHDLPLAAVVARHPLQEILTAEFLEDQR